MPISKHTKILLSGTAGRPAFSTRRFQLCLFLFAFTPWGTRAQSAFSAKIDNDAGISDRFYTSGVNFSYHQYGLSALWNPAYYLSSLTALASQSGKINSGYSTLQAGLDTYTPQYIVKASVAYGDRPYASWGYLGTGFHQNDGKKFITATVHAGSTAILSREAQTYIHQDSRYSAPPNGWDHQIDRRPGLQVRIDYEERMEFASKGRFASFIVTTPRVGTIYADWLAGLQFNYGFRGSDHRNSRQDYFYSYGANEPYAYFYLRPALRYVAHDSTLEGFYRSPGRHRYSENRGLQMLAFQELTHDQPGLSEIERLDAYDKLLVHRNIIEYRENFLTFNSAFYGGSLKDVGMQLLIYETLFRETKPYSKPEETEALILISLQQNNTPASAENLLFLRGTLFRQNGEGLHPYVRWLAFKKLAEGRKLSPEAQVAIYSVLFAGNSYGQQTYTVTPRRLVGELEAGFSAGKGPVRAVLGWNLQTAQFEHARGIADWQSYFSLSVQVLF